MEVPALVQVRRWASRTLGAVGDAQVADVQLVATQLIPNAYDHEDGSLRIEMSYTPVVCRIRIEVDDLIRRDTAGLRGRGMVLIGRLADT
ncbi:hypothetical protein [Amycolatopsis azurea]|uniref:Histidine kinase/HSP90-like ATPase domain-containing protein n=2 Tax=Amycolatopsis azurea TaxID=36819 RepID=M2NI06_9PSEU|nr:hypothetical protein [Amycolatopsis azurea]EMD21779.1 hypothetical protein C791_0817 [Amycolatopsis azurea DSM 43854]